MGIEIWVMVSIAAASPGGVALYAFLQQRKKRRRAKQEKEIFHLASRAGGRMSMADIVIGTSMTAEDVEQIMSDMMDKGYAGIHVMDSGVMVYEFFEMPSLDAPETQKSSDKAVISQAIAIPQKSSGASDLRNQTALTTPSDTPHALERVALRSGKSEHTTEINGFVFVLKEYHLSGNTLVFSVLMTNMREERLVRLYGTVPAPQSKSCLIDESGEEYWAKHVQIAGSQGAKTYVTRVFPTRVPINATLTFELASSDIRTIPFLEIDCKDVKKPESDSIAFHACFRDIALNREIHSGDRNASVPSGNAVQPVEANGYAFLLKDCRFSENTLLCHLLITNTAQERQLRIYGYSSGSDGTFLIDDDGDEYRAKQVCTSKTQGRSYISVFFPAGVPLRVTLAFELASSPGTIPFLQMTCREIQASELASPLFAVELRDIPVSVSDDRTAGRDDERH